MGKTKLAFFDMDGTLIAPLFNNNGLITPIFRHDWKDFCNDAGRHAYDNCVTITQSIFYASHLKSIGYRNEILTVTMSEGERAAKKAWFEKPGHKLNFDSITFVNSSSEKIPYILEQAARHGAAPADCILIEDDFPTLLKAHSAGIKTAHISHIITGCYDPSNFEHP